MTQIGVYGTGSFAVAIANILAKNQKKVLVFSHREELTSQINLTHKSSNSFLNETILATSDVKKFVQNCKYIFIIVPSNFFKETVDNISPHIIEEQIVIHGTKGFFIDWQNENLLNKNNIVTLSSILYNNLCTKNIAYLSGPNIAQEIHDSKPTSTLISSPDLNLAKNVAALLDNTLFSTYISNNISGAELCGILKNIYAIASGYIDTLGLNAKGTLITKALQEIIKIFDLFEYDKEVINSVAGIGDLIATSLSPDSRNHSLGLKLSQGISLNYILNENKTYEGLNSIKAIKFLANNYDLNLPIVNFLYDLIFLDKKSKNLI